MTTNKPEVVAWRWRKPIVNDHGETVGGVWELGGAPAFLPWWTNEPLVRLSDYERLQVAHERLQAECEKLRKDVDKYRPLLETVQGEPSCKEMYKEFSEWCQNNRGFDLDCRLHTHGGPIDRGGYISDGETRVAFAAYRAGRLLAPQPAELPANLKDIVTSFYYWWHNQPGSNTADGYDEWISSPNIQRMFATRQPAPDVSALVEALQNEAASLCDAVVNINDLPPVTYALQAGRAVNKVRDAVAALAAHRKGGDK